MTAEQNSPSDTFVFFVVDERMLPLAPGTEPKAVLQVLWRALTAIGEEHGRLAMPVAQFGGVFEAIGRELGADDTLAALAVANSPHHVLDPHNPNWRFGYFEPQTCFLLAGAIEDKAAALKARVARLGDPAMAVLALFEACVAEAALLNRAVAIVHLT